MSQKVNFYLRKIVKGVFVMLAKATNSNLTTIGYYQKGICKSGNDAISGEKFVIEKILTKYVSNDEPIFFDVGSNEGDYSMNLKKIFFKAKIFSFEANPNTYKKIKNEFKNHDINFLNLGLSTVCGKDFIYDYKNNSGSQHASIFKEVFTDIYNKDFIQIEFEKDTIDNFCLNNNIQKINFLKIDTEGSELDVLRGGIKMIENNNIDIIQFEFNEMNVVSRTFLKDYYDLLKNYSIYRIDSKKLIFLPDYKTENEIFKYQNFLAINKCISK